jgi:photosystem II stability/assembly factor-like uncharacterized protein
MRGTHAKRVWRRMIGLLFLVFSASAMVALGTDGWEAARRGPAGKDLNAVYFADSKRGWIAGDGGFLSRTEDGGRSWSPLTVGTTDAVNDVYFRNKENGYLLAGNRIFSTSDSGRTWAEIRRFMPADFDRAMPELYSVRFSGKKRGWVVGSISRRDTVVDSLLIYTNDSGASWQRLRLPTREELIHLDFVSDRRGWIVGAAGTILYTESGGETGTPQRTGTTATLYHVDFRNERTGWVVGERGTVLRTTDGGATWVPVTVNVRNTLLSVQFVDEDEGWIVGRGGVILHSSDGGRTWARQESKTTQNLYALFVEKKKGWAVGGDGVVLQYER